MLPLLAALFLGLSLIAAMAQDVPVLDVERGCKGSTEAGPARMKGCLEDEEDARKTLAATWSQFSSASRAQCTGVERQTAGMASYVELLTCLQLEKQDFKTSPLGAGK